MIDGFASGNEKPRGGILQLAASAIQMPTNEGKVAGNHGRFSLTALTPTGFAARLNGDRVAAFDAAIAIYNAERADDRRAFPKGARTNPPRPLPSAGELSTRHYHFPLRRLRSTNELSEAASTARYKFHPDRGRLQYISPLWHNQFEKVSYVKGPQ